MLPFTLLIEIQIDTAFGEGKLTESISKFLKCENHLSTFLASKITLTILQKYSADQLFWTCV